MRYWFFLLVAVNAISWSLLIPIWHTPDEQAHFAQVVYIAEKGVNPGGAILDSTEEIKTSEVLLGTLRDKSGNNQFTFHPEYKIEYTDSVIGKYEASISALAKTKAKSTFIMQEATRYPPLYYQLGSFIYKIFYNQDLFIRVFMVRTISIIFYILTVYLVYKIGQLIFPNEKVSQFILATFVAFNPMFVFASIGVTSDSFANFIFTGCIYMCMRILVQGLTAKKALILLMVTILAVNTKVQFLLLLPIVLILLFLFFLKRSTKKQILFKSLIIILFAVGIAIYLFNSFGPFIFIVNAVSVFNGDSFIKFTTEYSIPHLYKEVLPWYWGVYSWLSVTYPRVIHRVINVTCLVLILGFIGWAIETYKTRQNNKKNSAIFFAFILLVLYTLQLLVYDWVSWYKSGFQLGIQGRYFFPLISVEMLMLFIGWRFLYKKIEHVSKYVVLLVPILMLVLNIYAWIFISARYYSLQSFPVFIHQISQYKPVFFKGNFVLILICLFIFVLLNYIKELIIETKKIKTSKKNL